MGCDYPLRGFRSKIVGKTGKRLITFQRSEAFSPIPLHIPCGQCTGCRIEHSRQWAMRCVHESKMHDLSCFITLTYDDKHLPDGGTLVRKDPQDFLKRLRHHVGKFRFYGCGEYGDTTRRPHYHLVIFGYDFTDKKFYKRTPKGETLWTSSTLADIWPFGHNVIGDVTFDTCAYVARYVTKKITGDNAGSHYQSIDKYGEVRDLLPEFPMYSRRPGIGKAWFDKYGEHAYKFDSVIMNGREVRPPRYYDGKFEIVDSKALDRLKRKRARKAAIHAGSQKKDQSKYGVPRWRVRAAVRDARLNLNKRDKI